MTDTPFAHGQNRTQFRNNRTITAETARKIKERLQGDSSPEARSALCLEFGLSQNSIRRLMRGEIHPLIEPILRTQR